MNTPQMRPCRRCAYWELIPTGGYEGKGHCLRRCPTFFTPESPGVWPITNPDDKCGDGGPVIPLG